MDFSELDLTRDEIRESQEKPSVFVDTILNKTKKDRRKKSPYEYQVDFLDADNRRKCFVAGRQVGKSLCLSWLALHKWVTEPDCTILIFSRSKRQVKKFFNQTLKEEIRTWLDNKEKFGITHETKTELHGQDNRLIKALPATNKSGAGETIRGYTADMIICDEAAFIDDEFFTSVLAPMLFTTGGDFIIAGTPWGKSGYFYRKFRNERWHSIQVSTYENPSVPPEDIEEMREDMTKNEFKREVLGEFHQKENAAFDADDIKACKYKGDEDEEDRIYPKHSEGYCYLGVDPARYGDDRAAFVFLDDGGNVFKDDTYDSTSLQYIENKTREYNNKKGPKQICFDETGIGGGPVDQMKDDLRNFESVKFTIESKQEIYQTLRKELEERRLTLPDDREFLSELTEMEREETPRGRIKYHAPENGRDDLSDALALAVWAKRKGERTAEPAPRMYSVGSGDDDSDDGMQAYELGS